MESLGRKFPNRLRKHRRLANLKQYEVAHLLGVSQGRVSAWERGEVLPSMVYFLKLSILYKTLCNELYYELIKQYQQDFDGRLFSSSDE